jgi:hypothetical protein
MQAILAFAEEYGESMKTKLLEKVLSKQHPTQADVRAIGYYLDKMMRRTN